MRQPGPRRWVGIETDRPKQVHRYEITCWIKDTPTILLVCFNPEVTGSMLGGGNAAGLKTDEVEVTLRFPWPLRDARGERAGRSPGDGDRLRWKINEAVVMSFAGRPAR